MFKRLSPDFRLFVLAILLFALAFGLLTRAAHAADVTVTWTQPVTNTDGSAIPATGAGSIASNRVEWGGCAAGAFGTKAGEKVVSPAASSTTITNLGPGTWCFQVFARNTYGAESAASNVASKLVPVPVPNPPVVTAATLAYDLNRWGGVGRLVGTIALGVPCGELVKVAKGGATWHAIPPETVTLTRAPRSTTLVAKCAAA
jgi:hypothetical protein